MKIGAWQKSISMMLVVAVLFLPMEIAFAGPMLMHQQHQKLMMQGDMDHQTSQIASDSTAKTAHQINHQAEHSSDSQDNGCEKGCVKCSFCNATTFHRASNTLLINNEIKFLLKSNFAGVAVPVEIRPPRQFHS